MATSDPCEFPGCNRGLATGHALYRTSPKGQPFFGRCAEHMGEPVDPGVRLITQVIEDDNHRTTDPQPQEG